MLDQIKTELMDLGIESDQIIAINLESGEWLLKNQVELLYDYVKVRINQTKRTTCFLMKFRKLMDGRELLMHFWSISTLISI